MHIHVKSVHKGNNRIVYNYDPSTDYKQIQNIHIKMQIVPLQKNSIQYNLYCAKVWQPDTNWPEKATKVSLQEMTTNECKPKCQKLKSDWKQVQKNALMTIITMQTATQ